MDYRLYPLIYNIRKILDSNDEIDLPKLEEHAIILRDNVVDLVCKGKYSTLASELKAVDILYGEEEHIYKNHYHKLKDIIRNVHGLVKWDGNKVWHLVGADAETNELIISHYKEWQCDSGIARSIYPEIKALAKLADLNMGQSFIDLVQTLHSINIGSERDYQVMAAVISCLNSNLKGKVSIVEEFLSSIDIASIVKEINKELIKPIFQIQKHHEMVGLLYKYKLHHHARNILEHESKWIFDADGIEALSKMDRWLNDSAQINKHLNTILDTRPKAIPELIQRLAMLDDPRVLKLESENTPYKFASCLPGIIFSPLINEKGNEFVASLIDTILEQYSKRTDDASLNNMCKHLLHCFKADGIDKRLYVGSAFLKKQALEEDLSL